MAMSLVKEVMIEEYKTRIKGKRIDAKFCEWCGGIIFKPPKIPPGAWRQQKRHRLCSLAKDAFDKTERMKKINKTLKKETKERQGKPRECAWRECDKTFVGHMNRQYCSLKCKEMAKLDRMAQKKMDQEKIVPLDKSTTVTIEVNALGMQPDGKSLAEAHWSYIKDLFGAHGVEERTVDVVGFHYKSAFIHGFKHGVEAAKV